MTREQIYKSSIGTEVQVGAVSYRQVPSSTQLQTWGLQATDDYDSWSVTIPSGDASSYISTQVPSPSDARLQMKVYQSTSTTIEGGMSRIDIRVQTLEKAPDAKGEETEKEPDPDPEEEPDEDEEKEAGYGPQNSKTINADVTYTVAPLPTHPYIAEICEDDETMRTMVGQVHRGWNTFRPLPIDSSGNMDTPYNYMGAELSGIVASIHTFSVKVINITYEYTTFRSMRSKIAANEVGGKVDKSQVPSNAIGSKLPQNANCYFLGRNIRTTWVNDPFAEEGEVIGQRQQWTVEERYQIELIPSWEEVKKRGDAGSEDN